MFPQDCGEDLLGHDAAVSLWRRIIGLPATSSVVIQADRPVHGSTLVGFGSASFISRSFADDAVAHPRPGLNRRILMESAQGNSPILSARELKRDNTIGGLNLITMSGTVRPACEDDPELVRQVSLLLSRSFYEAHRGYRLQRLLFEVTEQVLRQRPHRMRSSPILRYSQTGETSSPIGFVVVDHETAYSQEGSLFALLFDYHEPRLRLSSAEQELLEVATAGLTDRELADRLGLSVEAIRSRWRTVLRKAAKVLPQVGPAEVELREEAEPADSESFEERRRGLQRRHHVLDYIREHREELRPFDWVLWERSLRADVDAG